MSEDEQMAGLDGLLSQAMEMQEQLMAARAEASEQEVEGVAGGGAVAVTVTGGMEFRAVRIDPKAVAADDVEMLQDLVLAALHDAVARVEELQSRAVGGLGELLEGMGGMLSPGAAASGDEGEDEG